MTLFGDRIGWARACLLAVGPPALTIVYWRIAGELTETSLWGWAAVAGGAALATGWLAGVQRGLGATVVVWSAVAILSVLVFGASCPITLDAVPHGAAMLSPVAAVNSCPGGDAATLGTTTTWSVIGAVAAGFFTIIGGMLSDGGRMLKQDRLDRARKQQAQRSAAAADPERY